ncbi:MAG: DUF58 domain-containing protein [Candidatus Methylumidiphilus sp.]
MLKRLLFLNFTLAHRIGARFSRQFSLLGHALLTVLGAAAAFGVNTRVAATYQWFTLLAALFAIGLLWTFVTRNRRPHITAERQLPRHATVGETLRYRLTLTHAGRRVERGWSLLDQLAGGYPDWAEFAAAREPRSRNPFDRYVGFPKWQALLRAKRGASIAERTVPDLPPGQRVKLDMELTPLRRGRLQFADLSLFRPDPFGLSRSRHILALPGVCTVLPRCYPMSALPQGHGRCHQRGGVALANTVGESQEFLSLRDYRQGDPLRSIHWRSSARAGRWVVKEFQDEYFVRRALVLDTFCDAARALDFEAAVSAAASLAVAEPLRDSLLDLLFVEQQAHCFTAGRGLAQASALLDVLAGVRPADGSFAVLAQSVLRRAGALSGVVCVLLDWDAPRREFAGSLRALGLPVAVLLVREQAPGPTDPGLFLRHVRPAHVAEDLLWN